MASINSSCGSRLSRGRYARAISNSSISALASASFVRRTSSRLGTRLRRRQSAPRITGIWLRSGSASVQGLIAAEVFSSTTLSVTASSKPAAVSTRRIRSNTRSVARARRRGHRHAHVFGNRLVAVDPRHLFDQVDLARQVAPPTGRNDGEGRGTRGGGRGIRDWGLGIR